MRFRELASSPFGAELVGLALLGSACDLQGPPPSELYMACEPPLAEPACVDLECAVDEAARDGLEIFLEEVNSAGHGDLFTPLRAESFESGRLLIAYQLQVDWFRTWRSINVADINDELALRAEFAAHIDAWDIPAQVVSSAVIAEAASGCDPILSYDPCTDNWRNFTAHVQHEWTKPGCVYKTTHAKIDIVTGEVLECVVEAEHGCDGD